LFFVLMLWRRSSVVLSVTLGVGGGDCAPVLSVGEYTQPTTMVQAEDNEIGVYAKKCTIYRTNFV